MTYSPEQVEDILIGRTDAPESMDDATRQILADHRVIRNRLSGITRDIEAPKILSERIRSQLMEAKPSKEFVPSKRPRIIRLITRHTPALAAAAVLILAFGIFLIHDGSQIQAAQPMIYNIHQANIAGRNDFLANDNPAEIVKRLQQQTHETIELPRMTGSCKYMGSTLATFRDKTVGCVVCQYNDKKVSILCVNDPPETLTFRHRFEYQGRTWWRCGYSDCSMVAVGDGDKTYIAVGQIGAEALRDLLEQIIAHNQTPNGNAIS